MLICSTTLHFQFILFAVSKTQKCVPKGDLHLSKIVFVDHMYVATLCHRLKAVEVHVKTLSLIFVFLCV